MIYDCFMFYENLELLELRLMTLDRVVDKFVIVEMGITHMNKPKPLHFEENKQRFEKYLPKIIHVKRDSIPWTDERQCEVDNRNLMAEGYAEAGPEDYIIISDEDEIPNPNGILEGIATGHDCFAMRQKLFYYYVNCLAAQAWDGCMVYKKKMIPSPQWIRDRRGQGETTILNGGWHYSFLGSPEMIMSKLSHFSEQQVNTPDVNNEENIRRCMETGEDMFHRTEWYAQKRFIQLEEIGHPELTEWLKKYPHNYKAVMKDEATHQPILFEAIKQTTGAILELGAGQSSTAQIHGLAWNRKILTVDDNQVWLDNFKHFESDTHQFALLTDDLFETYGRDWSVVLVDLSTWDQRMWAIEKLRYFAEYIIIHDAQGRDLDKLFVYHREYQTKGFTIPTTMLASNIRPLTSFNVEGASYG